MQYFEIRPHGVCAQLISFSLEDGKLHDVHFLGGCPGNQRAIAKLLEDERAERAVQILKGNRCGNRPTSCTDQLARGVEQAMNQTKETSATK